MPRLTMMIRLLMTFLVRMKEIVSEFLSQTDSEVTECELGFIGSMHIQTKSQSVTMP